MDVMVKNEALLKQSKPCCQIVSYLPTKYKRIHIFVDGKNTTFMLYFSGVGYPEAYHMDKAFRNI
jgi:hypothetical protein